ncbi:unnamed protein product [Paramecium primaurelia]|uniref:PSI domain-containing protein n=1 Tax=Paramecium primaurelia TaxID=5886 RepID=A0A8S1Q0V2_PARPR|nr:unnamed protein product [Paramecium primaurelia]
MNKQFIIFALLLALATSQTYSITSCSCVQLLSEADCLKNVSLGCSWDSTKKSCAVSTTPVTPTVTFATYCESFAEADCPKAKPCTDCGNYAACAWVGGKCTHFTGCTAFSKTTDPECQAISNRCITDGTHCVELDACSTYKKQLPCVKNSSGSLCYWDTTNNTCVDANNCDRLPTTFVTDKECRDVISTCTTKTGGGCVDSGNNCSDQTLEIQCVWNKLRSMACYWDGAACKDRICDNAPITLTTDETCKTFRTDGTCTTKANGGCVTRTTCAAATIQAACIKNSSGGDCYWTGTACVDKICTNAPTTMTTNSACAGFVTGCITKSGGGCVSNGACSAANVQAACVKNSSGTDCIWDTTCKEKTCANAPTTNNTHELCSSYLPTCTVRTGGGCQPRSCTNAPTTLTTNDACEAYLPNNNCITKTGGGCVTNTTCSLITLEAACIKNVYGATCFWDTASSGCKDKICTNAPSTNNTHDLCVAFLSTCTVNSTNAGCVEKTCENSLAQTICDKDLNNKACIWKGKCYKKECVLASSASATHTDCQTYDSSCTLSNTGAGCVPIPLKCEAYTIESACNVRLQVTNGVKSYLPCGWNGSQCIDKACSTASRSFTTTDECDSYKSGCVANNPVNGTISGCQDLPTTCAARRSTENCQISRNGLPTCLWNTATSACVEKTCATANVTTTPGFLVAFNNTTCSGYLTNSCIANNTADNCIPKPSSCNSLVSSNCQRGSKANGDCYWNGSSCVDRICTNITQTTHDNCQSALNTCTVNNARTACQTLATACTSYGSAENCKFISNGKSCIWTGSACRNATCADASDNDSYDDDSECSDYPSPTETCTVINKTRGLGCVTRLPNCNDYGSAAQCFRTSTANSDDCTWKSLYNKCFSNTQLQNACSTYTGNQDQCESIKTGCTNTASATESDACIFSCAVITGLSNATHADCQAENPSCTVNAGGTACVTQQAACSSYTSSGDCVRRTDGSRCHWNGSACADFVAANCASITGLSNATHSTCQAYHSTCTVNIAKNACNEQKAACSDYDQTTCTFTTGGTRCHWGGSACADFVAANCATLTGLTGATHQSCQGYHTGCTVNIDGTACSEQKAACTDYAQPTCTTTTGGTKCYWDTTLNSSAGGCTAIAAAADCASVTGLTSATYSTCQAYNTACTVNAAGNACLEQQANCSGYDASTKCTIKTGGTRCHWGGSACADFVAADCAAIAGLTTWNHSTCQAYHNSCTVNVGGTACQELKAACGDYANSSACTRITSGSRCFWDVSGGSGVCIEITSSNCASVIGLIAATHSTCQAYHSACLANLAGTACLAFTTCEAITGSNLTWDRCQGYSATCSVRRDGNGCITIQPQCSGYTTITSCYRSTAGYCTANSADSSCSSITASTTCEAIKLGASFTFNGTICNELKTGCIAQGTTGCQAKSCTNFTGTFNHSNCNTWLPTCTANLVTSPTACTTMGATCASLATTACVWAVEGECVVSGTSCVRKTCDTAAADTNFNTHDECFSYLSSCTVARIGGCQPRAACSTYKSSNQCRFNTTGGRCFWNATNKTCVDFSCGNIEQTSLYDTHSKCSSADSTCTVRATNGAAVPGCMARGACSSYQIEDQCNRNATGGVCVWNTNLASAACQDKSCSTAPTATATHDDCNTYFFTASIRCTVVATADANGGAPVLGGCQQTAACATYIHQEQCKFNATGDACGWNGTQCADKSCATAPATADYDDNDKCRAYFSNKCTVAESGQGCVDIPDTCETMVEKQCVSDKSGRLCYWNGTGCITRTCENAPEATASPDECNTYLAGCTLDSVKCKTKVCEDFAFATDALCKQSLSTCTTNGTNCITRGTCFQAMSQAGCVTSATNQQCEWMPAVGSNQAYCTVKTCNTAPVTLTSEAACAGYFTNCTTKNGGGCVTKSTCAAVTVDAACTTALNGTICAWDSAQNKCRDKDCQDFSGTTHAACQGQRAGCTAGANGKCARVQNCEQTTLRSACIEGTNGPCLWVNDFVNSDGSTGACFRYTSCKSLTWNSDTQCKWLSNQCTTNGSNCIGITLCSETNTDGGCVTGYDGACIQSVPALNSSDPKVCKPYTSCADAFYTTHSDCQIASSKCTTNGTTGCIALGACSSYTSQAGCVFNDKGVIYTSGVITSTGICSWDATASSCRDQSCADLTGTNHAACSSQLSTCTSDGTTCLVKGACSSYTTQTACTTAVGSDGTCYWELASATNNNTAKCRLLTCPDIQNGTATNVCSVALSSCVSDGTACITKANCSTYKTKTACNSGGLDGICVFTQSTATGAAAGTGTCALMTACTTANNDQVACQQARDRCSWTAASGTGATAVPSKCATHTCATNQATNGACTRFLNWDKKTQQVCTLVSGTCTATDPSTLSSNDCFLVSGYTYTWNAATSKCGVCTAPVVQPNNTDNNTNNTNNQTTTDSGYILGLSTVILGYLMF